MKQFKWVVEFTVDKTWIEDGFDITEERAKEMIEKTLPYSYGYETKAKVLQAPARQDILKAQGYTKKEIELAVLPN